MTKQELVAKMQEGQAWIPGKRVKLDFGDEGVVLLDGAGEPGHRGGRRGRHHDQGRLGRLAGDGRRPARRHDRVHDRQAQDRGRHVQRDAAAGRAREAEGLSACARRCWSSAHARDCARSRCMRSRSAAADDDVAPALADPASSVGASCRRTRSPQRHPLATGTRSPSCATLDCWSDAGRQCRRQGRSSSPTPDRAGYTDRRLPRRTGAARQRAGGC